jgi:hypothetical protein
MANFLVKFFSALGKFFMSGRAQSDAEKGLKFADKAAPFLKIAADIVVGMTPTTIDDLAWGVIRSKFPKAVDKSVVLTEAEMKGYALQIAAALLKEKFPQLDTTSAILATQLAYIQARGLGEAPSLVPTIPSAIPSKLSL